MRARFLNNLVPAFGWLSLSLAISLQGLNPASVLLWIRSAIIFACLLTRHKPTQSATPFQRIVSWVSALLPIFMHWNVTKGATSVFALALVVLGTIVVCISCLDLGKSFGVSPAIRPYVKRGIYKYIKHPMYLGHLLTEIGIWASNPSAWNSALIVVAWGLYATRILWERSLIAKVNTTAVQFSTSTKA